MFKKEKRALIPPRRGQIKASIFSSLKEEIPKVCSLKFRRLKDSNLKKIANVSSLKFLRLKDERTEEKDEVSSRLPGRRKKMDVQYRRGKLMSVLNHL